MQGVHFCNNERGWDKSVLIRVNCEQYRYGNILRFYHSGYKCDICSNSLRSFSQCLLCRSGWRASEAQIFSMGRVTAVPGCASVGGVTNLFGGASNRSPRTGRLPPTLPRQGRAVSCPHRGGFSRPSLYSHSGILPMPSDDQDGLVPTLVTNPFGGSSNRSPRPRTWPHLVGLPQNKEGSGSVNIARR